jgi:hypothetical protein
MALTLRNILYSQLIKECTVSYREARDFMHSLNCNYIYRCSIIYEQMLLI